MSILARLRPSPRGIGHSVLSAEAVVPLGEVPPIAPARAPLWPMIVLMAGTILSGVWVVALLRLAYIGLLRLFGTG